MFKYLETGKPQNAMRQHCYAGPRRGNFRRSIPDEVVRCSPIYGSIETASAAVLHQSNSIF